MSCAEGTCQRVRAEVATRTLSVLESLVLLCKLLKGFSYCHFKL